MGPEGVAAGLTVVGFTSRCDDQPGEQAIKAALSAAHQISAQLGADLAGSDESTSANGGGPRQSPGVHHEK